MDTRGRWAVAAPGLLAGGAVLGWWGAKKLVRAFAASIGRDALKTIMTDSYSENLWELYSASSRFGLQEIVELNLRSETGQVIERPLGSPRSFPGFDGLVFDIVALRRLPTEMEVPIDMGLTIGPGAARPLRCSMPMTIAGMAYGEALTAAAKLALAKGASLAGTAANTGEGPWLQEERCAAKSLILEVNRGTWSRSPGVLRQADAIEIQLGQGALGSVGHHIPAKDMGQEVADRLGVSMTDDVLVESRQPGVQSAKDFAKLVRMLRELTDGVPVGAKLGAPTSMEAELEILIDAGVDFIAIDGAEAATKGGPPILADDFGLPTVMAICRAADYLKACGQRGRVTLLAGGKISNPGRMLKAIALGADGVYIGSPALYAIAHAQILKAVPLEPPTEILWKNGRYAKSFDPREGAHRLHNYLTSCADEMRYGLRSLGYTSIGQVSRADLSALDERTASITGCKPAWQAT